MDSAEYHSALSALAWQIELGVDTCISDVPINRYEVPAKVEKPAAPVAAAPSKAPDVGEVDVVAAARAAADAAQDLEQLRAALAAYPHCDLKLGARNLVFSDGVPGARVMIVGEAPGRDEDREGRPFVGRAGQLLDKMLAAIGQSRTDEDPAKSVYIANILPWRPPGNRTPSEQEVQSYLPFMERHIQLAKPEVIFAVGNTSVKALLNTQTGIKRLRGNWHRHPRLDLPVMPSFHPAYLLRQAQDKRLAWRDLLALRAVLDGENT